MRFKNKYCIICRDRVGCIKWRYEKHNLVTNDGLDDVLNQIFAGVAYSPAWFIGLMDANGQNLSASDTASSHPGWAEVVAYSGARPVWDGLQVDSNDADNSADIAMFSMTGPGSCGGAFMISDSTKGGSTGILFGGTGIVAGGFTNGDTITVEISVNFAPPIG